MRKNTIVYMIIFLLTIFILIFIVNNRKNHNTISELNATIKETSETKKILKEKVYELENELLRQEKDLLNYKCEYIETYYFVGEYKFNGTVPSSKFIVVDKFQTFSPIIIEINTNDYNINFQEKTYYEFTFSSSMINGVENRRNIIKIQKTDKNPGEQIQEFCELKNKK